MTQGHGIEREGLLSRIILMAGYKRDARGPCLSQEEQECMSEEWPGICGLKQRWHHCQGLK